MRRNSSNFSRWRAACASFIDSGWCTSRYAVSRATRSRSVRKEASSGSAKLRALARCSASEMDRRSCQVSTSAFPDCGYTGTIVPVWSSPPPPGSLSGAARMSMTGFVICRLPR